MGDTATSASSVSVPPSNPRAGTTPVRASQRRPVPTAWVAPEGLDRSAWILHGRHLGELSRKSNWLVGDWLRFGTAEWGEKYTLGAKITGHDTHSLENMVYVASHVDISLRRENLSWSHHFLVAALEPEEQAHWLDMAIERRMSVNDLRIELKAAHRSVKSTPNTIESSTGEGATSTVVCPQCGFELPTESGRASLANA